MQVSFDAKQSCFRYGYSSRALHSPPWMRRMHAHGPTAALVLVFPLWTQMNRTNYMRLSTNNKLPKIASIVPPKWG